MKALRRWGCRTDCECDSSVSYIMLAYIILNSFLDEKTRQMWYAFFMSRRMKKIRNSILVISLMTGVGGAGALSVEATTISDIQSQMQQHQEELNRINKKLEGLEDEQDLLQEQIDDLNAEIVNTMTSIGLKEDEIAGKEVEISDKRVEIDLTQTEYEAAAKREEEQRESMAAGTRMMYENSDATYLSVLLSGQGLGDMLNHMDYVEKVYEYSKARLESYIEVKNQVHDLWERLETEKAALEDAKETLEADRAQLEELKANLDIQIAKKKQDSANFEAEINKAKQEAAVAKKLIQQDQQKINRLEAAQKAANATYATTDYSSVIDNASGSDLGKQIARFGCQYIGNPYVMGGTSLTNGADCSGFTYRIYQEFGYSIPRTSFQQRSAGSGVSYEEAQPGDLICYDGHVGLYIGGGLIVHASNARSGIKVSRAEYRTILAVRRII